MTYLVSVSSRKLAYFPEILLKKLKVKSPGKMRIVEENGKFVIQPIKDIMEFAGKSKIKAPADFDFRKYMEENYDRV
ncbi:MAG: hypothetical protein WCV93_03695 [Candidatus Shapirobacteria bacterium]